MSIAWFITPHGLGHAARAAAVMVALRTRRPSSGLDIFTRVSPRFFEDSGVGDFRYHDELTDIGVVQNCALREDISETVRRLDMFLPFDGALVSKLARRLKALGSSLVVADIAPLGLLAAREAGIPSVLIENFTWDWIYEGYTTLDPRMSRHADYMAGLFALADYHVQTDPVSRRMTDFISSPVSRKPTAGRGETRRQLDISAAGQTVLITMGGIPERYEFLEELKTQENVIFIIAGGGEAYKKEANLVLLPHGEFYHPNLVSACDAVVGKVGYSTVAEVYHSGLPFGYVTRPHFREAEVLAQFVCESMTGMAFEEETFRSGIWLAKIPALLQLPRRTGNLANGADEISEFLLKLL